MLSCFSCVRLFVAPWTVARQAPPSKGFPRQEYWSGLPCPPPRDLPDPGLEPASLMSPAMTGGFFTTSATWGAHAVLGMDLKRRWPGSKAPRVPFGSWAHLPPQLHEQAGGAKPMRAQTLLWFASSFGIFPVFFFPQVPISLFGNLESRVDPEKHPGAVGI